MEIDNGFYETISAHEVNRLAQENYDLRAQLQSDQSRRRDDFAKAALTGLLAADGNVLKGDGFANAPSGWVCQHATAALARNAVAIADATIAALDAGTEGET